MRWLTFFPLCLLCALDGLLPACAGSAFTAGDGGPSGEASTDAGPDAAGSWCRVNAPLATYCEDFDEYGSIDDYFHAVTSYSMQGGTLTFPALADLPSPPNALGAMTTTTRGVNTITVEEMPAPKAKPVSRRLEFDLYLGQVSGIGEGNANGFAGVFFGSTSSAGGVALAFGPPPLGGGASGTLAAVYLEPPDAGPEGFGYASASGALPTMGAWDGRVALEISYYLDDAGAPQACVQLYVGAVAQLGTCQLHLPQDLLVPEHVYVALGVFSGGVDTNSGAVDVAFDDVVYTEL